MTNTGNLKKVTGFGVATAAPLVILLAACSGGSERAATAAFSGSAVKGPLSVATANIDSNDDGICGGLGDAAAVTTDTGGFFSFSSVTDGKVHTTCTTGGTDTLTGADLAGTMLFAPPSTSPVVTPLTTLVFGQVQVSGGSVYSAADVAAAAGRIGSALGLANDVVIPPTPAAALAAEATANAVQTLLAGTAKIVASASGSPVESIYPSAIRGVASAVANSTSSGLSDATTLAVTREAIRLTIERAQAEAGASPALMSLSAILVSEIAAPALAANIAALATATPATLQAGIAQANASMDEIVSVMSQLSPLTSSAFADALGVTTNNAVAANDLATAVMAASAGGIVAAQPELATAATSAISIASEVGVVVPAPAFQLNALVLSEPQVNGTPVTESRPYSVTVVGPLNYASLTVAVNGLPAYAPKSAAAFKVIEVGGGRELWLYIDQLTWTYNSGMVTVEVPGTAKLYAYGKRKDDATFSAVLANANEAFASDNNVVSLNVGTVLGAVATQWGFDYSNLSKGTFDVTMAVKTPMLYMTDASGTAPASLVTMTAPSEAGFPNGGAFSGKGVTIRVTVN